MPFGVTLLYCFAFLILVALGVLVYRKDPRSPLHRYFALSDLALLAWLGTLFFYERLGGADTAALTLVGRLNFAAALAVGYLGFRFLQQITGRRSTDRAARFLRGETLLMGLLTVATPLIDRAEILQPGNGQHVTLFGPLFTLYALNVVAYLGAMVLAALRTLRDPTAPRRLREQARLIGLGIATTALIGITTDLALPFGFHDFAWQDVGTLSTLLYLGAVAYAILAYRLFDVRVLIRRTVVFALLLAFVLAAYGGTVLLLAQALPVSAPTARHFLTGAALLLIAFSFDPLRRFLEARTDRFLFRREYEYRQVLQGLTYRLSEAASLEDASEALLGSLMDTLHAERAALYVLASGTGTGAGQQENGKGESEPQETREIQQARQRGFGSGSRLFFRELGDLVRFADSHDGACLLGTADTPDTTVSPEETGVLRKLRSLRVAALVPVRRNGRLTALFLLGEKRSGGRYAAEDVELLEGVAAQTAAAVDKARFFEGDRQKSEFVSIAAHELLTPITAVRGYLSFVLDEHLGTVDAQAAGYLGKARTSIDRLQFLVKDLLAVSRLEAGRTQLQPQLVDLSALTRDAVDQLIPLAREKRLRLTLDALRGDQPAVPAVWADPSKTTEVLINLIGNAVKYTKEGSVTVTVRKAPDPVRSGQSAIVEITDTGIGMSPEALSHLFQKFYRVQTEATRGIQGTGLGLYITKQLVEKMGGTLAVQSAEGSGTTFTLALPPVPVRKG